MQTRFLTKFQKYLFIKSKAHELIVSKKNSKNFIVGIINNKAPFPYPYSKIEFIAKDLKKSNI